MTTPLNCIHMYDGETITILAHVLQIESAWDPRTNSIRKSVEVSDFSGTSTFLIPDHSVGELHPHQVIEAQVQPNSFSLENDGELIAYVNRPWDDIPNPFWCLPQKLTPTIARPALCVLVEAASEYCGPHLATFLSELVLFDYESFLTAPGANHFHHAYPGGLLVHLAGVWTELKPWLASAESTDHDIALGVVIAHDIGKLRKFGDAALNPVNRFQPHEILSMEMINGPLRRMGERWHDGAARLNRAIYWLLARKVERPFTSKLGKAVALADRTDAHQNITLRAA